MKDELKQLTVKKQRLDSLRPLPAELVKNLEAWFRVELTYSSNALEGNTLTRQETALVVEKGLTVGGKSLEEHLEATNHAEAIELVKVLAKKKRQEITEDDILQIHKLILQNIDDTNAGRYRGIAVRIAGAETIVPGPAKVPKLMRDFIGWLRSKGDEHPAKIAAEAHFKLVSIHPFVDGNGRTARLLMNLLLMQAGYPPALIRKEDREVYLKVLEKGQVKEELEDYYWFIYEAIERALDVYLEGLEPDKIKKRKSERKELLKIGELARETGETIHTIRFWTKQGLLEVKSFTKGGYQLYEPAMIERVGEIRRLQREERLSLAEIKDRLVD